MSSTVQCVQYWWGGDIISSTVEENQKYCGAVEVIPKLLVISIHNVEHAQQHVQRKLSIVGPVQAKLSGPGAYPLKILKFRCSTMQFDAFFRKKFTKEWTESNRKSQLF